MEKAKGAGERKSGDGLVLQIPCRKAEKADRLLGNALEKKSTATAKLAQMPPKGQKQPMADNLTSSPI